MGLQLEVLVLEAAGALFCFCNLPRVGIPVSCRWHCGFYELPVSGKQILSIILKTL